MHRLLFLSRLRAAALPLALAAGLALVASACSNPAAKNSSAAGTAGERAVAGADSGSMSGAAGDKKAKPKKPWWRLSQYRRDTGLKPIEPDALQPGRGLFSGEEGGFVLYRKGEIVSSDPTKPTKVRR